MNTHAALRRRNFRHEQEIETLMNRLHLRIESLIITDAPQTLTEGKNFILWAILPKEALVHEVQRAYDRDHRTGSVSSRGGTTAANVLSINVVAVWKKRDAYLFTGDAHLKDVTQAVQDFLRIHCMASFKYVDVPHHGSGKSNVKNVDDGDLGLARITADHYLISHRGNHENPSFQTVKDILKREDHEITLHFLYERRKYEPPVKDPPVPKPPGIFCKECEVGHTTTTQNWHCTCMSEREKAKIRVPLTHHYRECFVFFPFTD